jgi:hypothetical protein
VAGCATVCVCAATGALANGGRSIATAPLLPAGRTVAGSGQGVDFWRLQLSRRSVLSLQAQTLTASPLGVCLMSPKVDDAGLRSGVPCAAQGGTYRSSRTLSLRVQIPTSGVWHIALAEQSTGTRTYPGCIGLHYPAHHQVTIRLPVGGCYYPFAYRLTVYVSAPVPHNHSHKSHSSHKKPSG